MPVPVSREPCVELKVLESFRVFSVGSELSIHFVKENESFLVS